MPKKLILSQQNQSILMRWALSNTLMAFDFDGTLAPIVAHPQDAKLPIETWQALDALARSVPVAILSGRSCASLQARLPASVTWQVGNHGNEGMPGDDADTAARTRVCALWQRQIEESVVRQPALRGIVLENKGVTLSVHYRHCAHTEQAGALLPALLHALQPAPRLLGGLMVFNLLPQGSLTKREALQRLQHHSQCDHLLFVGDDVTDELAFAHAPPSWLTIRVGMDPTTQARYRVRHPAEVRVLIQLLVELCHQGQKRLTRLQRRGLAPLRSAERDDVFDAQMRQAVGEARLDERNEMFSNAAPQVPTVR